MIQPATGTLPLIFGNTESLYEGTLWYYLPQILEAPNKDHGFHNTRHTLHVVWLCYEAIRFYRGALSPRRARNLLVSGVKHDHDHSGRSALIVPDAENLRRAEANLRATAAPEDGAHLDDIADIMWATEYPHRQIENPSLEQRIIRDADPTQALHPAWFDQICLGLGSEWDKTPLEMLEVQEPFLNSLHFDTTWGKQRFPPSSITEKINEVNALLAGLRSVQ